MTKRLLQHKKKILLIALAIATAAGLAYYRHAAQIRSTENAYLSADVVQVAAQVGGRVIALHVQNNQSVRKGDLLFEIDPEPYRIALARAEANLAQALQTARQDTAESAAARAQIAQTEADLINARSHAQRTQELVNKHFVSQQSADDAQARVIALQAALQQAKAKLEKAQAAPAKPEERGDVLKAEAEIAQAKLDLTRTRVVAEQDGQVSNLTLTAGSLVAPGAPIFALIAKNSFHIDANFKETELPGIQIGQAVDIRIDMYPDITLHGTVESLSGGTGTAFSLLPPQNATGNWVKIAQRVPVRIKLNDNDPAKPLRIGATATVRVHLK